MTTGSRFRLGVDFGTTHTVAALSWPDGRVQPLLFESNPLLPSAVYAADGRRLLVGRDAERSSRVDPARFEPNPKRRIDERVVLLGAEEFRTADLVAAVLHRVYEEAVRVAGGPPAATVLTHPADWAATRLQTLTEAAAQAGIGAVTLVPEPLAAAAYFSATLHREVPVGAALVVYDFGGGTFDISVIRRRPDGGWDVLATEGLDDVGGVDLDAAVVERVGATVSATDPVRWQRLLTAESPEEQRRRRLLWDEVRAAKEQLSRTSVAVVHVPLFDTDVHLTREEFEQLAKPWLERTVALTAATLFRTGLRQDQVAGVVLVGGSTRIPMVGTLLHQRLGVPPTVLDQPELVVAQGSLVGTAGRPAAQNATLPFPGPPPVSAPPAAAHGMGHAGPPPYPGPPMTKTGAAAPPGPAWPGPTSVLPPRSRGRRRGRRALVVLSAVVAALVLGGVAMANVLGDDDGDRPGRDAGRQQPLDPNPRATSSPTGSITYGEGPDGGLGGTPSASAPALPDATGPATGEPASPAAGDGETVVRYELTVSGRNNIGNVNYTDKDDERISRDGIPLPWSLQFTPVNPDFRPGFYVARTGGGDGGEIRCRTYVGGKMIKEETKRGRGYVAVFC